MSRQVTIETICDECGLIAKHVLFESSPCGNIYTTNSRPRGWMAVRSPITGTISDRCPHCYTLMIQDMADEQARLERLRQQERDKKKKVSTGKDTPNAQEKATRQDEAAPQSPGSTE